MKPLIGLMFLVLCAAQPGLAGDFSERVLAAHNAERTALGLPPLAWSDKLAADAAAWASHLAELGRFEHSPHDGRVGEGENLWMGTRGWFTLEEMVGGWSEEKRDYSYGPFGIARGSSGQKVVGHYTQMIWRTTAEVGCAVSSGGGWDYLVCRYSPPGNWIGEVPY